MLSVRPFLLPIVAVPCLALALGVSVWWVTLGDALEATADKGRSDLSLAADRLVLELQRARDLAVHLADHPAMLGAAAPKPVLRINVDRTGATDAALLALDGTVLASAGDTPPAELAGPWLVRARQGALGYGADTVRGRFVHAAPVFGPGGRVTATVLVTRDLQVLERRWRGDPLAIYFTDPGGAVALTNRTELALGLPAHRAVPRHGHDLRVLDGADRYLPRTALHLALPLERVGLTAELLLDAAPAFALAQARGIAAGAVTLVIGAALAALWLRRRTLTRLNRSLADRVAHRTEALSREVAERRDAEAALQRAQTELVQAGKLSALGQMSAGIAHELNQPLMAIRSFAGNAATFLERGDDEAAGRNLTRIGDLSARMGRIIRNLNAFARAEPEPAVAVDLTRVAREALDLAQPRLEASGTTLDLRLPDAAVEVMGGAVRLGQVVTNLVANAVDAMGEGGRLCVEVAADPPRLVVRDTGPGLEAPDRVFDPFYSTKGVGEGLGLGLSISYGIVAGFGGTIRADNAPGVGAVFTVLLRAAERRAAA